MCGRYTLTSVDGMIEEFALAQAEVRFAPRYNIAPGERLPVIDNRPRDRRHLVPMHWGLVPHWARDRKPLINARCETLAEKPSFREAYRRRRCLVVADGFYEWRRRGRERTAFYMRRRTRRPLGFAAVFEARKSPEGRPQVGFAVVTTEANALMAPIHDRMPVIVEPADYDRWLAPQPLPPTALTDILVPPSTEGFELFEVSSLVHSVAHDSPACIEPGPLQGRLF